MGGAWKLARSQIFAACAEQRRWEALCGDGKGGSSRAFLLQVAALEVAVGAPHFDSRVIRVGRNALALLPGRKVVAWPHCRCARVRYEHVRARVGVQERLLCKHKCGMGCAA